MLCFINVFYLQDTSIVEVPTIIFEIEEGLLLDCNLNNSSTDQSEIEDERQEELGEYQREDSADAENEGVEEVEQELNITREDRNEQAEEEAPAEYVEQIADEGNNARDDDGMEEEDGEGNDVRGENQGRKKRVENESILNKIEICGSS